MNGIIVFLSIVASSAQIGGATSPPDVKYGWKPENDGSLSYIAQVTPEIAHQMATKGDEITLTIPDFLQGKVTNIVWRIGSRDVERDPSEAELRAAPRTLQQRPGGLTNLNNSNGQTVPIDPMRSGATMLSTAGTGRMSDTDPSLTSVPSLSLAQNFQSPTNRPGVNSQFDSPSFSSPGNFSSSSNDSVLPKQPSPFSSSSPISSSSPSSFVGPTLPRGYTGGPATVSGSSSSNANPYYDSRSNSPGSYSSTNSLATGSLATGNFGNSNNFVPGNQFSSPNNAAYSTLPPASYSTATSSTYPQTNSSSFANSQFNSSNPQNYSSPLASPDARFASNHSSYTSNPNYASNPNHVAPPYSNTNGSQTMAPVNNQIPNYSNGYAQGTNPPSSNAGPIPYTQPTYAQPAYAQPAYAQPPVLLSNINPSQAFAARQQGVNPNSRTLNYGNDAFQNFESQATQQGYLIPLLFLVSMVGNVYLVILLNKLLERYRTLQASSRGTSSLAM